MNNLFNREYHEAVIYLDPEVSKSIKLGNSLLERIPTNNIDNKKENPYELKEEDLIKLAPKLNFNMPETDLKFYEKKLINEKNYFDLMELVKTQYPFNKLEPIHLYAYCRKLCDVPMKKAEYEKIRRDMKAIKKACKNFNTKQMKKSNLKTTVKF